MQARAEFEQRAADQARRLREQLEALAGLPKGDPAGLASVARAAQQLQRELVALPPELAGLLLSAELGFMPGPAADAALPRHREEWDGRLRRLAQGGEAVAGWLEPGGLARYRDFLIRGYLRGLAHLWQQATGHEAEAAPDSDFSVFAQDWLASAGVPGDAPARIAAALDSRWRLAGD